MQWSRLILAVVLTGLPAAAFAQEDDGDIDWSDIAADEDLTVSRTFELENSSDLSNNGFTALYASGVIFATERDARNAFTSRADFTNVVFTNLLEDEGFDVDDPVEIDLEAIGDDQEGWRLDASVSGSLVTLHVGVMVIRQDSWIQDLLAISIEEDVVEQMADLAGSMTDRWPNGDVIETDRDGLRTGGPWAMMPVPDDVSTDLVWVDDLDNGPEGERAETGDEESREPVTVPDIKGDAEPDDPEQTEATDDETVEVDEPAATETPVEDEPAEADPEPTAEPTASAEDDRPDRLADTSTPIDLWILLPEGSYSVVDGRCRGTGALDVLDLGAVVSIEQSASGSHIESVFIEAPGQEFFDRESGADVCAFMLSFTAIPLGDESMVVVDDLIIGRFTNDQADSTEDDPAVITVVVGS